MDTTVTKKLETSKDDKPVELTNDLMKQYRESLIMRGCEKQTISMYLCYLNRLYAFLPEGKELTDENIRQWVTHLKKEGYSDRTINLHISSINGLLRFCRHKKVPISVISVPRDAEVPELTRDEYLSLLSYVKKYGSERDYLLIKTLATIDITLSELPLLTVEACQEGMIKLPNNLDVVIPKSLKQELFSYIEKEGICSGSVFITDTGNQLDRVNITHTIEKFGVKAGIAPDKSNPRALHSLYERTQEEITQHLMSLHMQEYEKLLDEEKKKVS